MKKIVVTGGAGFIGSHLTAELAVQGYAVVVLDDFSTASDENIASLRQKENVELAQGSITDLPRLQKLFEGIDYVFHQAAMARVPRSIEDPLTVNQVNITGTLNVLLAARDNSVKKVVFASSSSVYGDTSVLPQREGLIANPLSPYALTKLAGEFVCDISMSMAPGSLLILSTLWSFRLSSTMWHAICRPSYMVMGSRVGILPSFRTWCMPIYWLPKVLPKVSTILAVAVASR